MRFFEMICVVATCFYAALNAPAAIQPQVVAKEVARNKTAGGRFEVTEVNSANIAGTWILDKETGNCVSLVNQKGVGGFVQIHDRKTGFPVMVLHANGLQIKSDKGLLHWSDKNELLKLDTDKGYKVD